MKTRSIITVVALMSQGITDSSLKYHILNAKNHGVTQKEMAAIITHAAFYAGVVESLGNIQPGKRSLFGRTPGLGNTLRILR